MASKPDASLSLGRLLYTCINEKSIIMQQIIQV
jgi:hypothetical protein